VATVLTPFAAFCGWHGWVEVPHPERWTRIASPWFDLARPGEFVWEVPPTAWLEERGAASLRLFCNHDWQTLPMEGDAAIRITVSGGPSKDRLDVTLEQPQLAWAEAHIGPCDVEGGFEARVEVLRGNPALEKGLLYVEGARERDTPEVMWVPQGLRLVAIGAVLVAALIVLADLRRGSARDR